MKMNTWKNNKKLKTKLNKLNKEKLAQNYKLNKVKFIVPI